MRAKTGEQVDSYIPVIHDRIESDRLGFNWIGSDRIASHPLSNRRGWSKRITGRITVNHIWHNLTELFVVDVFNRIKVEESTSIGASWRNKENRWNSLSKIPGRLLDHFAFLFSARRQQQKVWKNWIGNVCCVRSQRQNRCRRNKLVWLLGRSLLCVNACNRFNCT